MTLREHAQQLAEELNIAGTEEGVTGLDILDALGFAGLTLVPDPIADSSMTYIEEIDRGRGVSGSGVSG